MKKNDPAACQTREDIRHEIDRLDCDLIALLAERLGYVHRMSEIKTDADEARVPWRVDEVINNARDNASAANLPPELAERLWTELVEFSIAYEEKRLSAAN